MEKKRIAGPTSDTKKGRMNDKLMFQIKNVKRRESKKSLEGEEPLKNLNDPIEQANLHSRNKKNPKVSIGR